MIIYFNEFIQMSHRILFVVYMQITNTYMVMNFINSFSLDELETVKTFIVMLK